MKQDKRKFFIVSREILPEAILKTAQVKEILARGEAHTVNQAVDMVGISRSAFYKYRDGVFPFHEATKERIITISLMLDHRSGILSNVLNTVASFKGNILTINQGIPLQGIAYATLSVDTAELTANLDDLINQVELIQGVRKVELVGQS